MTIILTDKQKQLFQEDKYVLVDTIIILENKLKKAQEELRFTKNELLLEGEAHIKAQEELDDKEDTQTVNKAMQDIEKQLDKAWEGEISSENFVSTVTQIFTGDYYDKKSKE
tara:strand:- start:3462 stop:3797 length:336 start_codon:yes stop_codon:yes gene_type:complete